MVINLIELNKEDSEPLFRQLTSQLIKLIQDGVLSPGAQLPGSRQLAAAWQIHRKTVVSALDQLLIEGWLKSIPGKGTFVSDDLQKGVLQKFEQPQGFLKNAPQLLIPKSLQRDLHVVTQKYHLDDGVPDPRLAPVAELSRAYKTSLTQGNIYSRYTYADTKGLPYLRESLSEYLKETRGTHVEPNQILITRGVTQALYLTMQGLISPGDLIAVPELNWESGNAIFQHYGAKLIYIRVDQDGLDTHHLEEILQNHLIKMVYVTPHHQYPTTVIMPAARRIHLIQLARSYGFYVFEDDYDFDFHYTTHPVMPLSSADHGGFVFYAGSFTKAISPVFRVGYLVANANQIDFLSRIRRMVDRQGDALLEHSIAELLQLGIIQRYLRRNKKIYEQRRNFFGNLLQEELSDYLSFELPTGGMSVWAHFLPHIPLQEVFKEALKYDLYVTSGAQIGGNRPQLNATRLGFASSTEDELTISVSLLRKVLSTY